MKYGDMIVATEKCLSWRMGKIKWVWVFLWCSMWPLPCCVSKNCYLSSGRQCYIFHLFELIDWHSLDGCQKMNPTLWNWLQRQVSPHFPHTLENMEDLYPIELSSHPNSYLQTLKHQESRNLRCFIVSDCSWNLRITFHLILILSYQGLLVAFGLFSCPCSLCKGKSVNFGKSLVYNFVSFQFIAVKEKCWERLSRTFSAFLLFP